MYVQLIACDGPQSIHTLATHTHNHIRHRTTEDGGLGTTRLTHGVATNRSKHIHIHVHVSSYLPNLRDPQAPLRDGHRHARPPAEECLPRARVHFGPQVLDRLHQVGPHLRDTVGLGWVEMCSWGKGDLDRCVFFSLKMDGR